MKPTPDLLGFHVVGDAVEQVDWLDVGGALRSSCAFGLLRLRAGPRMREALEPANPRILGSLR